MRTILGEVRRHWPDALLTLRQVPQLLQKAVREAGESVPDAVGLDSLRVQIERASRQRDGVLVAATLWICGVLWVALGAPMPWLGWLQLGAASALACWTKLARR